VVAGATWAIFDNLSAIDHFGHMGNALLISYAVLRFHLLDIKLVVRKGLVYSGITLFITFSCLLLIALWTYLLQSWAPTASLALTTAIVAVMAIIFNPLRNIIEKGANYLFYGKSYDYRETILSFSTKVNNIIDLEQLAEAMLQPLINAVRADQASLLFAKQGYFTSEYAQRYDRNDPVTPITLRKSSPVIKWLEREGTLLTSDIIWREPEFRGMWEEDRNALAAAEIEVLCPVRNKQKLVAVLALSKKHRLGFYSRDDTDLVMTLALGAAVAIENAELYEKAKERANTDELTNLFNHRFFHQRLDEELSRSSRFGTVFSLLFLDIDMFKTYNDVYGHLAGDEILRSIGRFIKSQVRDTDICFRYGGDEFAVILPETPADGVQAVAERIRKGIESSSDWPGDPITVSIGIACWPTDGVIREDLIHSSDAALYYAKQTGKNRTCLACEVVLSDVLRMETNTNPQTSDVILSTIYALAATVDAKDHYTYGHSKKVSQYSSMIAESLGYEGDDLERIRTAALLHDIGKIGISDRLLQKKESLTPDEWELIRAHPDLGVSIIKHIESLHSCLAAIQYHHEHYDGSGYPSGLKGSNIPLDARILSVADAFDAMTSARPYRDKGTYADAIVELESCTGTQFDPEVVKVFKNLRLPQSTEIISKSMEIPVRK
jgi:diguanylate cyclase (GGDEF)-like protein/putative nucleotidyltransferase with HDIG domain